MTRTATARVAGFTFLFYIAAGISSMLLRSSAIAGDGILAKLAAIAEHSSEMGAVIVLDLFSNFSALVLAVTLYAITRDEDRDIAFFGLVCRVAEGVIGAASLPKTLALLWLATAGAQTASQDPAATSTIGTFLLIPVGSSTVSATFFAAGSTAFSYLLARGKFVPGLLAWFGVFASVILVIALPVQLAGFLKGPITWYFWMPMLLFEVALALWLIIKGVAQKNN